MKPSTDRNVTIIPPEGETAAALKRAEAMKANPRAKFKSEHTGEVPIKGYEAIKYIDAEKGITVFHDNTVEKWGLILSKDEEDDTPSTDRQRWVARVESYFSTYPYRCCLCGVRGKSRPRNPSTGFIRLFHLDQSAFLDGSERDEDLAPICKPCRLEVYYLLETDPWGFDSFRGAVSYLRYRAVSMKARRHATLTRRDEALATIRVRRAERDAEWAEAWRLWKEEGISIPWSELHAKYSDIPKPGSMFPQAGPKPTKPTSWTDH